jgi:hypothetical protein
LLDAGNWHAVNEQGDNVDVGKSGMLIGIKGRHTGGEGNINQLTFIFAKEAIEERSIEEMELIPTLDEINKKQTNE